MLLKQSTAKVISLGPFVDKTDGVTPETGLVSALDHASTGILLSKNGGALTIRNATVTATTYDAYGNYRVTLDTTDTNTLGTLRMQFIETATCLPVWMDFEVVPATVYDALMTNAVNATGGLVGATGAVTGVSGVLATTTNITAGVITTVTNLTNAPTAGDFTATMKAATLARVTLVDTVTTYTGNTAQTGDSFARIGTAGAGLTNVVLPSGGLANVTAWTVAITGNVTGNLSGSVGSVTGLTVSNLDAAVSSRMATYAQPTGFLAASFPSSVGDATAANQTTINSNVSAVGTLVLDLPTNAELATALGTADDAVLAALALKATQASVDDLPTNAELAVALGTADDSLLAQVALVKAKTDLIPASPAAVGSTMTLDLTQAFVPTTATETVGGALAAARAQGFGKWELVGTTLTLYAADGTTAVRTFTLDSATAPTSRV